MIKHVLINSIAAACLLLASFAPVSVNKAKPVKSILDYYKALKPRFDTKHKIDGMPLPPLRIVKKDLSGGFIQAIRGEGMLSTIVDLALWRSKSGVDLIGVFEYGCGGMGCWGDLKSFRFFDANLRDVTANIAAHRALVSKYNKTIAQDAPKDMPQNIRKATAAVMVTIPQKGTSIKVMKGYVGFTPTLLGTLVYNYAQGTFSLR